VTDYLEAGPHARPFFFSRTVGASAPVLVLVSRETYRCRMHVTSLDHIVLVVANVARTCAFYEAALGMRPVEHRPGQWALQFGTNKISLQEAGSVPSIARGTTPGSGNFCVLTSVPIAEVVEHLRRAGVTIIEGPAERIGAAGRLLSVYFHDPDGNLVEVSNLLSS